MIQRVSLYLLALVAGYAAMVLLIWVAQDALFGGIVYGETPLPQLLIGGLLTTAAAIVGGAIATRVFGNPWVFTPALTMCGLVVLETTYMTRTGQLDGPLWFDVMAAGALVFGILLGAYLASRLTLDQTSPAAAA